VLVDAPLRDCLIYEAKTAQVADTLAKAIQSDNLHTPLSLLAKNSVFREYFWQQRPFSLQGVKAITNAISAEEVAKTSLTTSNSNWFTRMGDEFKEAVYINRSMSATGNKVDEQLLETQLKAKTTFSVNAAGLLFPTVAKFCLSAMRAFGLPANANMYATYKDAEVSVPPHNDPQDLLILQMSGEKWWTLHEPRVKYPTTSQCVGRGDDNKTIPAEDLQQPIGPFHMKPGTLLYVPFGMVHRTSTANQEERTLCQGNGGVMDEGCTSVHLAMGLHMESYGHVYAKVLECATLSGQVLGIDEKINAVEFIDVASESETELRKPLPLGFPVQASSSKEMRRVLREVVPLYAKYAEGISSGDLLEQIESGLARAEDVIADQHEALLEKFETSYVQASKREDHGGLNGYDWLNEAMADYQKLTMKRCSPELSRKLNM